MNIRDTLYGKFVAGCLAPLITGTIMIGLLYKGCQYALYSPEQDTSDRPSPGGVEPLGGRAVDQEFPTMVVRSLLVLGQGSADKR